MTGDTSGAEKYPALQHFLLILPTLLVLAALYAVFHNESAIAVFFETHSDAHPRVEDGFEYVSRYANIPYYLMYGYILFTGLRRNDPPMRYFVVSYLLSLVATLFVVEALKHVVGRPRPDVATLFSPFSGHSDYESFPSAHMTETTVSTLPLVLRYGQIAFPLIAGLSNALMGFSRIYLGEHHPSDIGGGLLLGSLFAVSFWHLMRSRQANPYLNLSFLYNRKSPPPS